MKTKNNKENLHLKVGAFILAGIALTILAIFMLGSRSGFLKNQYQLYCYFDDISGLAVGSQVTLAGVNVGHVESIEFEERETFRMSEKNEQELEEEVAGEQIDSGGNIIKETGVKVKVTLKLEKHYQDRIRRDTVASITTQGLLGDGIVFLSVGSRKAKMLKDGDQIVKVRNPTNFTHLQRKGELLMKDAKQLLTNTNGMVKNLNAVLIEVKDGDGLIHKVIYDKETAKIVDTAGRVVDNLNATTQNFASITNKIDEGKGTIGKFVNDPGVYNDLKTLLGKANRNKLVRSVIRYTLSTREEDQSK